ncbi:MAG TPA: hypothetical protein VM782_19285 [Stellaceae bacterium]|nr:hypothetical protein [Stellaceae bacterium]
MRARRLATYFAAAAAAIVVLISKPAHIVHLPMPVLPGCSGWLFLNDEFAADPEGERAANFAARIEVVKDVARFFAARGIALVVVPVPDKARVETKRLCGLNRPGLEDRFGRLIGQLEQAGIKVIDLLPALQSLEGDAYYRTDTHWNQNGAKRAAETVAARLRDWGLASKQRAEFRVTISPPTEYVGDLLTIFDRLGLPGAPRPSAEIQADTVIQQSAPEGVGLLDEVPPPDTVLIGTSFTSAGHFGGFLALALGAPIDNRGVAAGRLTGAARAYIADPVLNKAPPRVVIWEMLERYSEDRLPAAERIWAQELRSKR